MAARTSAALRLRGRDGPLRAESTWPAGVPAAVLVFLADGNEELCRTLGEALNAVTLSAACATHRDARATIEWTGDHAAQLGVDPARLILAGVDAAAAIAAQVAGDEPWPAIERLVLIHPGLAETPQTQLPPTVIAADDDAGRACAARLQEAGVAVTLLDDLGALAAAVH